MSEEISNTLHRLVVAGIVRVVRFLDEKNIRGGQKSVSMQEIVHAGERHLPQSGRTKEEETASLFIFEFIKDGLVNLNSELIGCVVEGDYRWVWNSTNVFLHRFGYDPVDPVEIDDLLES